MTTRLTNITLLAIVALVFIVGALAYPLLPDRVASHWNAAGEVNGYMGKFWGVFLLPVIMLGMFAIYIVIPKIDPLKNNIGSFRNYYNGFWVFISLFFLYIFSLSLAWNFGVRFNFTFAIIPAMAMLYYVMGVTLGKSKRNWFFGIRTPWTLSSDFVWEKTHELGGKLFKLSALIALGGLLLPSNTAIIFAIVPVVLVAIITTIYSYFEHKKEGH